MARYVTKLDLVVEGGKLNQQPTKRGRVWNLGYPV